MLHRCVRGLMCDATSATQHQRVFLNGTNIMYLLEADPDRDIDDVDFSEGESGQG